MELEKAIGDRLRKKGWTLSIAESCTGGLVSDRITNVPGSSDYFEGGVVSYSIRAKARHLSIPLKDIERYGPVSSQIAMRMAQGVRKAFHTTLGLSITGVAGPTGGTGETPIGTVFISIFDGRRTFVRRENLKGNRRTIKEKAAEKSLRWLYEYLEMVEHRDLKPLHQEVESLKKLKDPSIRLIWKAPQGIAHRKGYLGIFPASFNPPTLAHFTLIREAKRRSNLDEILILLDIQAMDKRLIGATLEDRLIMLKMLFQKDPKISIGLSNRGLFIQKLQPLRMLYPSPTHFTFMIGLDTLLRVMDKKYYQDRDRALEMLFGESRFLVANREDQGKEGFEAHFKKKENQTYRNRVSFFSLPPKFSSLSSSLIRKRIRGGKSVSDLIPPSILRFIKENGLYTEKYLHRKKFINHICESKHLVGRRRYR